MSLQTNHYTEQLRQPHIHEAYEAYDAMLKELTGLEYEHAVESGLFEPFQFDPETGQSAIAHILGGELKTSPTGATKPVGFHHAPSGESMWPVVKLKGRGEVPSTRVSNIYKDGQRQRENAQAPLMEPYEGEVVIGGLAKTTGKGSNLRRSRNSFFPNEYDALAVLKTIKMAYDTRDIHDDELLQDTNGKESFKAIGKVPLIDGVSEMSVLMYLSYPDKQIITATPLMSKSDQMNLGEVEMFHHLTGGLELDRLERKLRNEDY